MTSPSSLGSAPAEESFYGETLSRAERMRLARARQVQGLDDEIALLRVRIARLAQEEPEKTDLLLKGVRLLVQAVATRYRLSPQAQDDLAGNIAAVLRDIGGAFQLEAFGNGV
ncbi:MAG: hypothetical protein HYY00_07255 [Chloroflexi bacterium]|nr:hypothetical protein [Chloroflexota bacterium]